MLTENCNLRCKYCFDDTPSDRTSCDYNYKMNISLGISLNFPGEGSSNAFEKFI